MLEIPKKMRHNPAKRQPNLRCRRENESAISSASADRVAEAWYVRPTLVVVRTRRRAAERLRTVLIIILALSAKMMWCGAGSHQHVPIRFRVIPNEMFWRIPSSASFQNSRRTTCSPPTDNRKPAYLVRCVRRHYSWVEIIHRHDRSQWWWLSSSRCRPGSRQEKTSQSAHDEASEAGAPWRSRMHYCQTHQRQLLSYPDKSTAATVSTAAPFRCRLHCQHLADEADTVPVSGPYKSRQGRCHARGRGISALSGRDGS